MRQFDGASATNNPANVGAGATPVAAVEKTAPERPTVDDVMLRIGGPLTNDQILQLRQRVTEQKRAIAAESEAPPKLVVRDVVVDLRPGAQPSVVRLGGHQVSWLNLIDSGGTPWPIRENGVILPPQSCADAGANAGDTAVHVTSASSFGSCSIGILLEGLSTPITIQVVNGQGVVDSRVDLRIPRRRDGSVPITSVETVYDTELQQLLDLGTAPGAMVLKTSAPTEVEAWLIGKRLIVKTRPGVMVTGYRSRYPAADGTSVFDLTPTAIVMIRPEGSGAMRPVEIINLPPT